jgi:hypothetical protein
MYSTEQKAQENGIFTRRGEILSITHSQDQLLKKIAADCKAREEFNIYDTHAHRVLLTSVHKKCEIMTKKRFVGSSSSSSSSRNETYSRMVFIILLLLVK